MHDEIIISTIHHFCVMHFYSAKRNTTTTKIKLIDNIDTKKRTHLNIPPLFLLDVYF